MKRHIIPAAGVRLMSAEEHLAVDMGEAVEALDRKAAAQEGRIELDDGILLGFVGPDWHELVIVEVREVNSTSMMGTCALGSYKHLDADYGDMVTFERRHVLEILGPSPL